MDPDERRLAIGDWQIAEDISEWIEIGAHALGDLRERQRVAIARALVNRPVLLLADEPTGNLDSRTGREILDLFKCLSREQGITLLLVTHSSRVAQAADRVLRLSHGQVIPVPMP